MADTDPEDEVDDVDAPTDRVVDPDQTLTDRDLEAKACEEHQHQQDRRDKREDPQLGRQLFGVNGDVIVDVCVGLSARDQRFSNRFWPSEWTLSIEDLRMSGKLTSLHDGLVSA